MSKMQALIDKAEEELRTRKTDAALQTILEAIKLLSRGTAQIMGDIKSRDQYRDDIPIGGDQ